MKQCLIFSLICTFSNICFAITHNCVTRKNGVSISDVNIDINEQRSVSVTDITGKLQPGALTIPLYYHEATGDLYYLGILKEKKNINFGHSNSLKQISYGNFIIEGSNPDFIGYNDHINGLSIGCRVIGTKL